MVSKRQAEGLVKPHGEGRFDPVPKTIRRISVNVGSYTGYRGNRQLALWTQSYWYTDAGSNGIGPLPFYLASGKS